MMLQLLLWLCPLPWLHGLHTTKPRQHGRLPAFSLLDRSQHDLFHLLIKNKRCLQQIIAAPVHSVQFSEDLVGSTHPEQNYS